MCIVLEAAQYLSGGCDLSAKVIILLFAHKNKQKSLKELYGALVITISNPVVMFFK